MDLGTLAASSAGEDALAYALVGRPWSALSADWIHSDDGAAWRAAVDAGVLRSGELGEPLRRSCEQWLSVLGLLGVGDTIGEWSVRARLWHSPIAASVRGPLAQAVGLCGDVPAGPAPITVDAYGTLRDVLGQLQSAWGRPLVAGDEIGAIPVAAAVRDTRADEVLCAVGYAVAGEWRDLPGVLFLSAHPGGLRFHQRKWFWRASEGLKDAPRLSPTGARTVLIAVEPQTGGRLHALSQLYPVLSLETLQGATQGAAMLVQLAPSQAVLWAREEGFDPVEEPPHCVYESLQGFCAQEGIPLSNEAAAALKARVSGAGALSGTELIAAADSVGVRLIGVRGTLAEVAAVGGTVIVHLNWGHYVAVTDCDCALATLLGASGHRARFPRDVLEGGMSGYMFAQQALLDKVNSLGGTSK